MLFKYGKRKRDLLGRFFFFLFSFVCYIMGTFLIKQLALRALLAIYHLISNERSWNNL